MLSTIFQFNVTDLIGYSLGVFALGIMFGALIAASGRVK